MTLIKTRYIMHLKKYIGIILFATISYSSIAQNKYSFGVNSGTSFQFNSIYNGYYSGFTIRPEYNIGIDFAKFIGAKSRVGIELNYENMGVGRNWNIDTQTASPTTLQQSRMHIDNWGINLSYSYRLLQHKKLDVYGSSSLKFATSTSHKEKSTLYDGSIVSSHYLDINYRNVRAGAAVGLRLKYNFTEHWALTVLPEYTCYFRNFYYLSSGPLQSIRCNLGMDLSF